MQKPRCGVPDVDVNGGRMRVKRYWAVSKWSKTNLKYYLTYGEDLSQRKQSKVFANAFKMWSDVAPKLKFSRTYTLSDADLKIRYYYYHCYFFVIVLVISIINAIAIVI